MAWTYEQTFNELNTADLNGQDSWSGDTKFDVMTTSPYEGAKAVECIHEADSAVAISRSVTGVSAGVMYISMKCVRSEGTSRGSIYLYDGATVVGRIFMFYTGAVNKIQILTSAGGNWIDLDASISANTWYRIGIEWDNTNQANKYRANVNGGTFSSWYNYTGSPTWSKIDKIELSNDGGSSGTRTMHYDFISPDYSAGPTYTVEANKDSLSLVGKTANLARSRIMAAGKATISLAGKTAVFAKGYGLLANKASIIINGISATFRFSGWTKESKPTTIWTDESK